MQEYIRVGIVGDFDSSSPTHAATKDALTHAAAALRCVVEVSWIPTHDLEGAAAERGLEGAHAIWAAPGSPYRSMNGALDGIRFAREKNRPFLGT